MGAARVVCLAQIQTSWVGIELPKMTRSGILISKFTLKKETNLGMA